MQSEAMWLVRQRASEWYAAGSSDTGVCNVSALWPSSDTESEHRLTSDNRERERERVSDNTSYTVVIM